MKDNPLSEKETKELEDIIEDLKLLFKQDEILGKEFEDFLKKIKSDVVREYLISLPHSKPEDALKDKFFYRDSVLVKYLFKKREPEVTTKEGFVDYVICDEKEEEVIKVEVKPPFVAEVEKSKSGSILKRIKKQKLNWDDHEEQIRKYLEKKGEFIILTNLEDWYLSGFRHAGMRECKYFAKKNLFEILEEYPQVEDLNAYLDWQEDLSYKEPLDKEFFKGLKTWVEELEKVKFTIDEKEKRKRIINLINKFIFVQSLVNFRVAPKRHLEEEWNRIESKWKAKRKLKILDKFLKEIDDYFYSLYDTELFRNGDKNILNYVEKSEKNIDLFYEKIKLVLGERFGVSADATSWIKGIIQYNFRLIDEDILGKSYEKYLAEVRKEQGIYYTPKYITQYIVENTVGKQYDELLSKIKKNLEKEEYGENKELIQKFTSIKVLDPACGSGSFLIKALKTIYKKYDELNVLLSQNSSKYSNFNESLVRPERDEKNSHKISELQKLIDYKDKRDLISKIIIRHIHGNDLDSNALEVAKVNIWLEAIKLAPEEFRFDRVPEETEHILPDLEMNLGNGDSLVGLPEDKTIQFLKENHEKDLEKLFDLRNQYLEDPTNEEVVEKINEIKTSLKKELDEKFKEYLKENNLPEEIFEKTIPFHWALDFWFVFFDENLEPKPKEEQGFDAVIGNPPYFTIRGKGTGTLTQTFYYPYLQNSPIWKSKFRSQSDIYYYFTLKSENLLGNLGRFGFIIENYWLENDYADKLKEEILTNSNIQILLNFGNIKIFEDAGNDTCVLIFEKAKVVMVKTKYIYCKKTFPGETQYEQNQELLTHIIKNVEKDDFSDDHIDVFWVDQKNLGTGKWILSTKEKVINLLKKDGKKIFPLANLSQDRLKEYPNDFIGGNEQILKGVGIVAQGMSPGVKEIFAKNNDEIKELGIEKEVICSLILNSNIRRYELISSNYKIIYPYYIKNLEKYPNLKKYLEKNKQKLISGSDRKRLLNENKIRWFDFSVYRNRKLYEKVKQKILCPYRAKENSFALDIVGYFGTTDIYSIIPKQDSKININYLLGLLNSKLLTFWYKEAGKSKGGMLEFFTTPLKRIPIYKAKKSQQEPIIQLVDKITTLKKLRQKFREIWMEYIQKYRNNYRSLGEILLNDKKEIQEGNFDKVWISESSIYPNGKNELLEKEFNDFKIIGKSDDILKIYGISGSDEELILEIKAKKKEFRDILYLGILELLESRSKVKTLKDIFDKTTISVIQPNIWENSGNLIKGTEKKFEEWLDKQDFETKETNIIEIDNQISDIDNQIDAHVFKLYGLNREEIGTVFDSLNTLESVKNDILEKFRGIK